MGASDSNSTTVLVGGATGRQGGAVARHLLEATGYEVRALTRSPESEPARRLSDLGATITQGDLLDVESMERALSGVDRAFFMTDHASAGGVDRERAQGSNVIDAAESQGVDHLVFSSTVDADIAEDVPHFASKRDVETRVLESSVAGTVLRPSAFYQNFEDVNAAIPAGFLMFPMNSGAKLPMFDVRDLGKATAEVLADPAEHAGEVYDVCEGLYTMEDVTDAMSSVGDVPVRPVSMPTRLIGVMEDDSIARMFDWFNEYGKTRDGPETELDVELTDLETYLRESGLLQGGSIASAVGRLTSIVRRSPS